MAYLRYKRQDMSFLGRRSSKIGDRERKRGRECVLEREKMKNDGRKEKGDLEA